MKHRQLLCWILLPVFAAGFLFNLAFASQAGKEYNDSEKELNATYQEVLAAVTDPQDRRLLVEAQRSWIKFRDAEIAFQAYYFPSSKGGLFVATDMTQERTKKLKILLTPDAKEEHKRYRNRK